jgi:hypothetical protein
MPENNKKSRVRGDAAFSVRNQRGGRSVVRLHSPEAAADDGGQATSDNAETGKHLWLGDNDGPNLHGVGVKVIAGSPVE